MSNYKEKYLFYQNKIKKIEGGMNGNVGIWKSSHRLHQEKNNNNKKKVIKIKTNE